MEQVCLAHQTEYGMDPAAVVSAPGRIHLLGEHSWYFKDKTLSAAIDMPVTVAVSPRTDQSLRFHFVQLNERKRLTLAGFKYRKEDRWANACKAVLFSFLEAGFECTGLNFTIYSDIAPSAGFGITTAIKVATAGALRQVLAPSLSDEQLVLYVDHGNKAFLEINSFISDIYTVMFARKGSLLLTDYNNSSFSYVPFNFDDKCIILTDSKVPRVSVWNEESLWKPEYACLLGDLKVRRNGAIVYEDSDTEINEVISVVKEDYRRRLLCIMKEQQELVNAVEALKNSNFALFARAVSHSHELLRDLFSISCPEIDWLVRRVQETDLLHGKPLSACARITGKGFGRVTYTILPAQEEENYYKKLSEYERIFGFHPSCYKVSTASGMAIKE